MPNHKVSERFLVDGWCRGKRVHGPEYFQYAGPAVERADRLYSQILAKEVDGLYLSGQRLHIHVLVEDTAHPSFETGHDSIVYLRGAPNIDEL